MAFFEFTIRSGGSNLNAGTRNGTTEAGTSADFTYASGNYVQSTGVFTVASGNPLSDGVLVGDFVSIYADGSSVTGFIAKVTARDATTITVDTSVNNSAGTNPTDGTGNRTLKVGGAWSGPSGADTFVGIQSININRLGNPPRYNFKNDQTYSISTGLAIGSNGTTTQGYTSTFGDGGKATIDGSTNAIVLVTLGGTSELVDFIVQNNGSSGTNAGISVSGGGARVIRCVVNNIRGNGISVGNTGARIIECEAYACNLANSANFGGMQTASAGCHFHRCISHDNTTGSNCHGFIVSNSGTSFTNCIAESNAGAGVKTTANYAPIFICCDFYNNSDSGYSNAGVDAPIMENCNFLKNGDNGVAHNSSTSANPVARFRNCAFGVGTQANTNGNFDANCALRFDEVGHIDYASGVQPWTDAANGDFRINLSAAKNTGLGTFTQTASSYAGTVSYPDIGAGQANATTGVIGVIGS